MTSLGRYANFSELQRTVDRVYGLPNDRWFDLGDMLNNVHRFSMRAAKAVRKGLPQQTATHLAISLSWFTSASNRLNIDLEGAVWDRFPYACSYCGSCPCACGTDRERTAANPGAQPRSIAGAQRMFGRIYPADRRSESEAVAHMAEELGEFAEAVMMYRNRHRKEDLDKVELEAADFISCALGVFNSLHVNAQATLYEMFRHGCHECRSTPCICQFSFVMEYKMDPEDHI